MVKEGVHGILLVSWPSPLYAREKGSGNIVYELSQRNVDLRFSHQVFSFQFESYSAFAVQKRPLYIPHYLYDNFVVSITHFYKVGLQRLNSLSLELES